MELLGSIQFIGAIEARQGLKVACLEEIALRMNYVSAQYLNVVLSSMPNSDYKSYIEKFLSESIN